MLRDCMNIFTNLKPINITIALVLTFICISANANDNDDGLLLGMAIKHDTSPPLLELLSLYEELELSGEIDAPQPDYIVPNILNIDPSPAETEFYENNPTPSASRGDVGTNGLASPPVLISVDGYTQNDNAAVGIGGVSPPDTNGDVGIDYYIQYVNLGWKILNKTDGSVAAGPFRGNTFWAGFGGRCQSNNAGDPIVLYDKQADRWVFSQFVNRNNTAGIQCFAISTTNDPLGPYHRYQFLFPGEFNDYPHIGVWDDVSGDRSGYYFVTHDFGNNGFNQASYAVVERTAMLDGNPAQFVRFTDTFFNGAPSFGALPAHLESKELPPSGMCNPFVAARPNQSGYQLVELCVNWDNAASSFLSDPLIVSAGESFNPGPGSISQPGGGADLDTLAQFGRIMYRASFRAYPDEVGLKDTMVFTLPVDIGGGHAAVRWAQINFPDVPQFGDFIFKDGFDGDIPVVDPYTVPNQGEYAPDSDDRWMSAISIDKTGNIGMAYSATNSAQSVFPGVRFTTRAHGDPANTLREEQVCVDGGGVQTGNSRWGDYSSVSVDPVDECTFWATVEYPLSTGGSNWGNRVCSFKMLECDGPSFNLSSDVSDINVCALTGASNATIDVDSIVNFTNDVSLAFNPPLLSGFTGTLTPTVVTPTGTSDLEISVTNAVTPGQYIVTVEGSALDTDNKTLDFNVNVSNNIPGVTTLLTPVDIATGVAVSGTEYTWSDINDSETYLIEISSDVGFNNIVESATTTTNSYQSSVGLESNTTYYWRVTVQNSCGQSASSSIFEFTTGSLVDGSDAECPNGSVANIHFYDNIEGDVSDWTLPTAPIGTNTWVQSSERAFSGSSWYAEDLDVSSDQYLVSPPILLPSISESPISLSYWNFQDIEANDGVFTDACWDGGLLEISTDGGANYTQIFSSQIIEDPYNGTITDNDDSPISGLNAWCATSAVPATGDQTDITIADLDSFAGQTVQFRFRLGTDNAVGAEGWYLDNVTVQGCQVVN